MISGSIVGQITVYGKTDPSLHGEVTPFEVDSAPGGTSANISLDGISFRAGA